MLKAHLSIPEHGGGHKHHRRNRRRCDLDDSDHIAMGTVPGDLRRLEILTGYALRHWCLELFIE